MALTNSNIVPINVAVSIMNPPTFVARIQQCHYNLRAGLELLKYSTFMPEMCQVLSTSGYEFFPGIRSYSSCYSYP